MKIASVGGRLHLHTGAGFVDVGRATSQAPTTLLQWLLAGSDLELLKKASASAPTAPLDAALDAPLQPGQLIDCFAFEGHVKNARSRRGQEVPEEWYKEPVYYRSNPRGLVSPGGVVHFPADEREPDYECELAAVIGARLKAPTRAEAAAGIFGYTLFNDWSARSRQKQAMKVGLGPNPGKDFASSLGPVVVTADEFGDPAAAVLEARVNGETVCHASIGDARWSFPELICAVSENAELWPGDVVAMGTVPNGCGLESGRWLKDGDRVELFEARIGTLAGTVGRAPKYDRFWVRQ